MLKRKFLRRTRSAFGLRDVPLSELRAQAAAIMARLRAVSMHPAGNAERIGEALDRCCEAIGAVRVRTEAALEALKARRAAAGDQFRLLQITHRTIRRPTKPDLLKTLLVIVAFWLLEGMMAGGVLISGGKVDVVPGIAYGLIFAGVNIILGVLIGFLGLRFLGHRTAYDVFDKGEDASQLDRARAIRIGAWVGTISGLAAEAVLIFSAARLRALGSHEGVFDFSQIGFWATYSDSLGIIITVIGVCSAVLAIREGYGGLADPIPGYAEAYDQATTEISHAAEDLAEDAIADIEDMAGDALDDATSDLDALTNGPAEAEAALLAIAGEIDAHNNAVTTAREAAKAAAGQRFSLMRFVRGCKQAQPTPFDSGPYDALILPRIDDLLTECRARTDDDAEPVRVAMGRVEAAEAEAISALRGALAAVEADASDLDTLFDPDSDDLEENRNGAR